MRGWIVLCGSQEKSGKEEGRPGGLTIHRQSGRRLPTKEAHRQRGVSSLAQRNEKTHPKNQHQTQSNRGGGRGARERSAGLSAPLLERKKGRGESGRL